MFFLPLFDDNPPSRRPLITWMIMMVCILVFLYQTGLENEPERIFIYSYGAIPALILGTEIRPDLFAALPSEATVITSVFMHGGWLHLGGNMLYLWIFGDNVEDAMGAVKFTIFYLLCGIAATLSHIVIDPSSITPLVGASGAIAGILASYLMLFPHAKVRTLVFIIVFVRWVSLPAIAVLMGWLLIQFLSAPTSLNGNAGGVAYFAHLGGFAAGFILTPFFKRRGMVIFPPRQGAENRKDVLVMDRKQIRNEFVKRYRHTRRDAQLKSSPNSVKEQKHRKGPWG